MVVPVDPVSASPVNAPSRLDASECRYLHPQPQAALDGVAHWTRIGASSSPATRLWRAPSPIWRLGALLGVADADADWLDYEDRSGAVYRAVHMVDERVEQCAFISPRPDLPSRAWLASMFANDALSQADRASLLSGQAIGKGADAGPTVCSCFGVGRNTICSAIRKDGLTTVAAVTACVKAGGNCGSCVPEIKQLLAETLVTEA
jgi:assimilatory nitrate reductase catalytic subunit